MGSHREKVGMEGRGRVWVWPLSWTDHCFGENGTEAGKKNQGGATDSLNLSHPNKDGGKVLTEIRL